MTSIAHDEASVWLSFGDEARERERRHAVEATVHRVVFLQSLRETNARSKGFAHGGEQVFAVALFAHVAVGVTAKFAHASQQIFFPGEEHERHIAKGHVPAHGATETQAIETRHHHVAHNHVGARALGESTGGCSVIRGGDDHARGAQLFADEPRHHFIVVDHKSVKPDEGNVAGAVGASTAIAGAYFVRKFRGQGRGSIGTRIRKAHAALGSSGDEFANARDRGPERRGDHGVAAERDGDG